MELETSVKKPKKLKTRRTKIRGRILRLSVISCLTVIVIILGYTIEIQHRELLERAQKDAVSYAEIYANNISQWMDLVKNQLEIGSANEDFFDSKLNLAQRKELLADYAELTEYKDLSIAYQDGSTYNNTDISERDYFKCALNGTTYISSPVIRKTDNKLTIMVGAPLKLDNVKGVIYGALDINYFTELIDNVDYGEGGYAFLVDNTGTIIAHPDITYVQDMMNPISQAKVDTSYVEWGNIVKKMTEGKSAVESFIMPNGEKYLVGYKLIDEAEGWSFAVMLPEKEITISFYKMVNMCVIIGIFLIIAEIIVASIISSQIAKPIVQATTRLVSLSDGDLISPSPKCKRGDETELLVNAVEKTITNLNLYIGDIREILKSIADSDLDKKTTVDYTGDFNTLKVSLDTILSSLNVTFRHMNSVAGSVFGEVDVLMKGTTTLSESASTEASAMEELTATILDISDKIKLTASNVENVSLLMDEARNTVKVGSKNINEMIEAMSRIEEASSKIGKIINVIDSISAQTSILALNASIEATHAGEYGKGFAVVAQKINGLVEQTTEAAKETNELIQSTLATVEVGNKLTKTTAESLHGIVDKVDNVSNIMESIKNASNQESYAIGQINEGVEDLNNSIQTIAATATDSANSCKSLTEQAKELEKLLNNFKLREESSR